MSDLSSLPVPSPEMLELSQQLQDKLRLQIAKSGPLPFSDFMHQALYANGLGYYSNGLQKFGAAGDFITAPHVSSLFSYCLARQCQEVFSQMASGCILEFGAGSGQMALDILTYLAQHDALPETYFIVELSADLQQRQYQLFARKAPDLLSRVQWLRQLPVDFEGVVLANEVLDAMPVSIFTQQAQLQEVAVTYASEGFQFCTQPPSDTLCHAVKDLGCTFAEGYQSEVNTFLPGWIAALTGCVSQGVVLLLDYGFPAHEYYHPSRHMGTLMCHYRHHAHGDPLSYIGLQDITAHVDFTAVACVADDAGFDVLGFTHQGGFLTDCGLDELLAKLSESERLLQSQCVRRLVSPNEMGELFKVMALGKNMDISLGGFHNFDQLHRL